MPGPAFPSWAYNATLPAQIVASQAAFNALGAGWQLTPFAASTLTAPADPGFVVTDTRLQQLMIEARISNLMLLHILGPDPQTVDLQGLRNDVLASDSSLTS